jgi:hypothetical protein
MRAGGNAMDDEMLYFAAFIVLISVAVAMTILAVRRDGPNLGEVVKQLIVWVGISALLPLTSYAGATVFYPRTVLKELTEQRNRAMSEVGDSNDPAFRARVRDKQDQIRAQIDEHVRRFNRAMFLVSFPIGLAALVVGLYLRVVPVAAGLAFGGLCTLGSGCYSYWDHMGDRLRFFSLLGVLVVLITLGLLKFRANPRVRSDTATPSAA